VCELSSLLITHYSTLEQDIAESRTDLPLIFTPYFIPTGFMSDPW
jgi:hypothetical protein